MLMYTCTKNAVISSAGQLFGCRSCIVPHHGDVVVQRVSISGAAADISGSRSHRTKVGLAMRSLFRDLKKPVA
ncbi:hypothetical protein RRG08_037584 [Elysia crispata]|uniref:Uncharacterized protein n=1 Tax=Elysia crispata TaxID=231223 RepID=A0AAE1DSI3_9GAST|nr:hypothetical protein RRG08_037584 [Elysia crispata]